MDRFVLFSFYVSHVVKVYWESWRNNKRHTSRHILMKLLNQKRKNKETKTWWILGFWSIALDSWRPWCSTWEKVSIQNTYGVKWFLNMKRFSSSPIYSLWSVFLKTLNENEKGIVWAERHSDKLGENTLDNKLIEGSTLF